MGNSEPEAVDALGWAIKRCKKRNKQLWLRGEKTLDRFGKSSTSHFSVINKDKVICFVKFDTAENVLFTHATANAIKGPTLSSAKTQIRE